MKQFASPLARRVLVPAVLSATALIGLSACSVDEEEEAQQFNAPRVGFNPVNVTGAVVPFPFDAFFAGFNDPTLNIPNTNNAPFVDAANQLDGFSTVASAFTDVFGQVDLDTVAPTNPMNPLTGGIFIVNRSTGAPLFQGVDYQVVSSPALDTDGVPLNVKRTRLLIQPLRPLSPSTTYIVAVTRGLAGTDGQNAEPSPLFLVAASDTPVSEQDALILDTLTEAQKQTMEAIRSAAINPVVRGLEAAMFPRENLALAWSFTTQSIPKTLQIVRDRATPQQIVVGPASNGMGGTLTTGDLGLPLPPVADIFAGAMQMPYFQQAPSMDSPTAPLNSFWQADPAQPDVNASFLGQVPCGAFAVGATLPDGQMAQPSESTTICFPVPVQQSTQSIPVLVTVPNANSGQTMPADGWPVVIFQHGITQNRTNLFPIAPALAASGQVAIAIDHPLHGITDTTSPFYADGMEGRPVERTFNVDYVENIPDDDPEDDDQPDGTPDPSGAYYLNLENLLAGRDNLRESVASLSYLIESIVNLDLDGNPATDEINESQIRYVGHSLGGIVGGTLLGVDTEVGAASLANPGGGIAKLLDGSLNFGPVVRNALAPAGIPEGTDTFETFLRFAQTVIDSGDPINYAVAANANHPIHMIETIPDTVVPNSVPAGPTDEANDQVLIGGPLSGTDPLYMIMGLDVIDDVTPMGPMGGGTPIIGAEVDAVVRLNEGGHSSILDPSASQAATVEIQNEIANYTASGGTCLPVNATCSAPAQ